MFKTNNKKYAYGYIPPLDKPIEDMHCYDLEDVFQRQKVDMFLEKPQKTIQETKVINFGIINNEIKGASKEKVKTAEIVVVDDFINYNLESKLKAFDGVLKTKKKEKDRMLANETKTSMKEFLLEHKFNCCCYCYR